MNLLRESTDVLPGALSLLRRVENIRPRLLEVAFQPCVGKQRAVYHPSLHPCPSSSAVRESFLRLSHTSPIKFIIGGG